VSENITAADAARAALAVAEGAPPIAIVAAVGTGGDVRRMIVHADGTSRGNLGDATVAETALRLGRSALASGESAPAVETMQRGDHGWLLYVETHHPPERLVIVGAGHIAVPLAHLGVLLDFHVTVLDDREEFATAERFDERVNVRPSDFASDPFAGIEIDSHCYVALVTRGHRWDFDCLQRLVRTDARPRYIGMIGSRRRVRAAFHALLEAGTPRAVLAGIHAPIGLEIGAETPAEIAVAIAAELIAVRRGTAVDSISSREDVLERFLREEP
jgi:xanthine dehydrogenase accessory factor